MVWTLTAYVASDVGRVRARQEDSYLLNPRQHVYAVADGLGGLEDGDLASRSVVTTLKTLRPKETLAGAIERAHTVVLAEGGGYRGSTVAAWRLVRGTAHLAWVGDSRIYRLRAGALERLTEDHRLGRNTLARAIGVCPTIAVATKTDTPQTRDQYLLCTDGLWEELSDDRILALWRAHPKPQDACRTLVEKALEHGGRDNITALVLALLPAPRGLLLA